MIVTPQSRLCIMRGIPWTNDYKHTRFFISESQQNTYMTSMQVREFSNFTYIREQNVIRVPASADDLYNCNYLRYMNNGFGTKWFYAFITSIKYVNTETAEISFEIDYFQTWWFNVNLGHCYVEREHVADDTIGRHLVEEDIGTGEIVPQIVHSRYWKYNSQSQTDFAKGMDIVVQVKPTLLGSFARNQTPFNYMNNQIVPNYKTKSQPIDAGDLNDDLMVGTLTGAEIGDAYMFPYELKVLADESVVYISDELVNNNIKRPDSFMYSKSIKTDLNPSYTPKNNKLFTYPYTYLYVQSSDGNSKKFKWENTKEGYVTFDLRGCAYNVPSCSLMPHNYMHADTQRLDDVPINNFPKVSLGQFDQLNPKNIVSNVMGITGSIAGAVTSGNPLGAISNTAQAFTGLAMDTTDKDFATNGNSTLLKSNMFGYVFYVMGIHGQNAKVIDDYLTRFGYKVNVIKVPELTSRKRWNYVKTKECEIHAKSNNGAPTDALQKIQDMFNAGVTLWHVNDVGNFDGDNGIVS